MPNIRVSDEIYGALKCFADNEMRSVANATEYLIKKGLANEKQLFLNDPLPQKTEAIKPAEIDLADVFIEKNNSVASNVLDDVFNNIETAEVSSNVRPDVAVRSSHQVMAEINAMANQFEEDMENCQDRETRSRIEKDYRISVQPLWDEFNYLKTIK